MYCDRTFSGRRWTEQGELRPSSNSVGVKEARVDYSRCGDCESKPSGEECICSIEFELSSKFTGRAFHMYYGLEKYYQNHRKYATSRSDKQLRGYPLYRDDNCEPFESDVDSDQYFAPCGLIANSMFNERERERERNREKDRKVYESNSSIFIAISNHILTSE
eukprot:sb/3472713/